MTETTSQPGVTVALLGHSTNSDNLGVGALTVSDVAILRDLAAARGMDLTIRIIDYHDPRPAYVTGEDLEILRVSGRDMINGRVWRALSGADLVIDIGAGDSFADIYGWKRLSKMMLMVYQAHASGTPVVLAPQTMGPFRAGWARWLVTPHLNRCRGVFTRDTLSTEALRAMGYAGEIGEASDVALRLPYTPPAPRPDGGPVKVGINVSGLLMSGGYTGKNELGIAVDYPALIRSIIEAFRARNEAIELHLVPHVISDIQPVEDDHRASAPLAEAYPGTVLAPRFDTPSEAKSYIAGLDFFMGARMHATIAAFSSGVPVVPMAYSRKFRGLFGSIGYDHVVDCTSDPADRILATIMDAFDNRDALEADRAAALARGREKLGLYEERLGALLDDLSARL